jgi:hypothetical protein
MTASAPLFPATPWVQRLKIWLNTFWREHRRTVVLLGAVGGVLGGSAFLGLFSGSFLRGLPTHYLAVALAFAPVLVLAAERAVGQANLHPVIILLIAAFVPLSLPTGTGSRLVFSLVFTSLFVGLWVMRSIAVEKRFRIEPSPVNAPLIGFMAATLVSLVWSQAFRDPLVVTWRSFPFVQAASTLVMIMLPAAFLIVANSIRSLKLLGWMTGILIFAGALGLARQFLRLPLPVNVNGLFSMWVIGLCVGVGYFYKKIPWWGRAVLFGIAGGWIIWGMVLHISWLAGWLPGLAALGVITLSRSVKLVIVLAVLVLFFGVARYEDVLMVVEETVSAESAESGHTRLAAWEVNWRVTSKHWLFGTGAAGYAAYYMTYFPLEGTATHSNYIDILSQTGIVGFSLCLWFFLALAWQGYRLLRRLRGRGDLLEALSNVSFAGTIGCMIMMAFGDWLFPFAYTQSIAGFDYAVYNWLFMGFIPVIERLTTSYPPSQP